MVGESRTWRRNRERGATVGGETELKGKRKQALEGWVAVARNKAHGRVCSGGGGGRRAERYG